VPQLARVDAGVVAEVEAQAVGRHQAARLLDVGSERLAQGRVKQVGARVVAHGTGAPVRVDLSAHDHAGLEAAGADADVVHVEPRHRQPDVAHLGRRAVRVEHAAVADLAARLAVEGVRSRTISPSSPRSSRFAGWPCFSTASTRASSSTSDS